MKIAMMPTHIVHLIHPCALSPATLNDTDELKPLGECEDGDGDDDKVDEDGDEVRPLGKCAGLVSKAMSRTSLAMLKEKEIFKNQKCIGNNFECEFFH